MSDRTTFTSESVTEGHPDKMADQISDAVLDAMLDRGPDEPGGLRDAAHHGLVVVAGEITHRRPTSTSRTLVRDDRLRHRLRRRRLRLQRPHLRRHGRPRRAVARHRPGRRRAPSSCAPGTGGEDVLNAQGAGDQGMMFGYACDETPDLMPLPIWLAHRLAQRLAQVRRVGRRCPTCDPTARPRSRVVYEDGRPVAVDTVLISTQHQAGHRPRDAAAARPRSSTSSTRCCPPTSTPTAMRVLANPTGQVRARRPPRRHRAHRPQDHRRHLRRHGPPRRRRLLGQGPLQGRPLGRLRRALGGQARRRRRARPGAARSRWPTPSAWPGRSRCWSRPSAPRRVDPAKIAKAVDASCSTCARRPSSATSTCAGRSTGAPPPTATSAAATRSSPGSDAPGRRPAPGARPLSRSGAGCAGGRGSCRVLPDVAAVGRASTTWSRTAWRGQVGVGDPGPRRPPRPPGGRLGRRRGDVEPPPGVTLKPARRGARARARRRPCSSWPGGRPGAGPARWRRFLRDRLAAERDRAGLPRPPAPRRPPGPPDGPRPPRPAAALAEAPAGRPCCASPPGDRPARARGRGALERRPTGPVLVLGARRPAGPSAWPARSRRRGRRWPPAAGPRRAAGWPVVVGARAAAWAPVPRLAAAVVLDAHDEAYREERAPTTTPSRWWPSGPGATARPCLLGLAVPDAVAARPAAAGTVGRRRPSVAGWPRARRSSTAAAPTPATGLLLRGAGRGRAGTGRRRGAGGLRPQPDRPGPAAGLRGAAASWPAASAAARPVEPRTGGPACVVPRAAATERPVVCAALRLDPAEGAAPRGDPGPRGARGAARRAGGRGAGARGRGRRARRRRCWWAPRRCCTGCAGPRVVAFLDFDQHLLAPRLHARPRSRWPCWPGPAGWSGGRGEGAAGRGRWCRPGCPTTRCSRPPSTATRGSGSDERRRCAASSACPPFGALARSRATARPSYVAQLARGGVEVATSARAGGWCGPRPPDAVRRPRPAPSGPRGPRSAWRSTRSAS